MLLSDFDISVNSIIEPKYCGTKVNAKVNDFPEVCVSTFSQRLIEKFAKMDGIKI